MVHRSTCHRSTCHKSTCHSLGRRLGQSPVHPSVSWQMLRVVLMIRVANRSADTGEPSALVYDAPVQGGQCPVPVYPQWATQPWAPIWSDQQLGPARRDISNERSTPHRPGNGIQIAGVMPNLPLLGTPKTRPSLASQRQGLSPAPMFSYSGKATLMRDHNRLGKPGHLRTWHSHQKHRLAHGRVSPPTASLPGQRLLPGSVRTGGQAIAPQRLAPSGACGSFELGDLQYEWNPREKRLMEDSPRFRRHQSRCYTWEGVGVEEPSMSAYGCAQSGTPVSGPNGAFAGFRSRSETMRPVSVLPSPDQQGGLSCGYVSESHAPLPALRGDDPMCFAPAHGDTDEATAD
jgi:hypothetical protein